VGHAVAAPDFHAALPESLPPGTDHVISAVNWQQSSDQPEKTMIVERKRAKALPGAER
jgi:hypothetical protein